MKLLRLFFFAGVSSASLMTIIPETQPYSSSKIIEADQKDISNSTEDTATLIAFISSKDQKSIDNSSPSIAYGNNLIKWQDFSLSFLNTKVYLIKTAEGTPAGVMLEDVTSQILEDAGLKSGDILVSVGENLISKLNYYEFKDIFSAQNPPHSIELYIWRNGDLKQIKYQAV